MISADHQWYRFGIVISSTTMTLAYYQQWLWNACTDHCYAKKFCQKIFGRIFHVRLAKGRVFKVRFFNKDDFSLGPVFLIPLRRVRYGYLRTSLPGSNLPSNDVQSFNFLTIRWYKSHKLLSHVVFVDTNVQNLKATWNVVQKSSIEFAKALLG